MATEDPVNGCKLTSAKQAPWPGIVYTQGVRAQPMLASHLAGSLSTQMHIDACSTQSCTHVHGAMAGTGSQCCPYRTQEVDTWTILQACGLMFPKADGATVLFDLSLYERELLLAPPDNTYPLAVRMETITAAGEAEGHTLQVRCLL